MENTETSAIEGVPQMGFIQRLTGIFFEPGKTFEDISRKRSWFGIFLILCIVSLGANYALQSRMDPSDAARKGFAMSKPFLKKMMSAEQIDKAEEQVAAQASQPRTLWAKISPIVLTPVMVYLTYLLLAAIFLLVFMMTGASISFKKAFTVAVWGMGAPGILVTLLSLLFIFVKNPADLEIAPVYNVVSNLGMLADPATRPVLNSLLSSIDLVSIWTIFLLAVGFAAMSEKRLTVAKAATPVVVLWIFWVLLKLGFWSIMG
jgi:hypothetical protein